MKTSVEEVLEQLSLLDAGLLLPLIFSSRRGATRKEREEYRSKVRKIIDEHREVLAKELDVEIKLIRQYGNVLKVPLERQTDSSRMTAAQNFVSSLN